MTAFADRKSVVVEKIGRQRRAMQEKICALSPRCLRSLRASALDFL